MAGLSKRMQELEEMAQEMVKMMASAQAGKLLRQNLEKQEQMIDKLLLTKKTTVQLIQVAASYWWNELPDEIRALRDLVQFRRACKMELFRQAFK